MKNLKTIFSIFLALFVLLQVSASPFIGLGGEYSDGYGCITLLWPCQGDPTNGGDVNFDHVQSLNGYGYTGMENDAENYWVYYLPNAWGHYGFGGTGINYCTSAVWSIWSTCWDQWCAYGGSID